ncbi:MAG: type 11 methyltransferase [Anaerolineaceae bacterium]|nr:MAG: type 11 methyltransferase [Anaerolineaceae bacterium]
MDPREYELMFQVEDRHWWYRGMDAIMRTLLNQRYASGTRLNILDAGCGSGGGISNLLVDYGSVTGVDIEPIALAYCRKRSLSQVARASVIRLPFANAQFDIVASFDVLYERAVPDDLSALCEFMRVLAPGGRLFLRLPAYDWLRGQHDRTTHARKRYARKEVKRLLTQSGFIVERLSFANMFLFPIAALKRLSERLFLAPGARSDLEFNAGPLNGILRTVLTSEAPFIAGAGLPFGLSIVAVGRKI